MNKHLLGLLGQTSNAKRLSQRVFTLLGSFKLPHEHDLEQSLSFEFYYRRKGKN